MMPRAALGKRRLDSPPAAAQTPKKRNRLSSRARARKQAREEQSTRKKTKDTIETPAESAAQGLPVRPWTSTEQRLAVRPKSPLPPRPSSPKEPEKDVSQYHHNMSVTPSVPKSGASSAQTLPPIKIKNRTASIDLRFSDLYLELKHRVKDMLIETLGHASLHPSIVGLSSEELSTLAFPIISGNKVPSFEAIRNMRTSEKDQEKLIAFVQHVRGNTIFLWERALSECIEGAAQVKPTTRWPKIRQEVWQEAKRGIMSRSFRYGDLATHIQSSTTMILRYLELTPGLAAGAKTFLRKWHAYVSPNARSLDELPRPVVQILEYLRDAAQAKNRLRRDFDDDPVLSSTIFVLLAYTASLGPRVTSGSAAKPGDALTRLTRTSRSHQALSHPGTSQSQTLLVQPTAHLPQQEERDTGLEQGEQGTGEIETDELEEGRPEEEEALEAEKKASDEGAQEESAQEQATRVEKVIAEMMEKQMTTEESAKNIPTAAEEGEEEEGEAEAAKSMQMTPYNKTRLFPSALPGSASTADIVASVPRVQDEYDPTKAYGGAFPFTPRRVVTLRDIDPDSTPTRPRRRSKMGRHQSSERRLASSGRDNFTVDVQHSILQKVQGLLEERLHAFFLQHKPLFLANNGWNSRNALELHVCLQKLQEAPGLGSDRLDAESWAMLSRALQEIRHIAVHRDTVSNERLCDLIGSAVYFVDRCLSDREALKLLGNVHLITIGTRRELRNEVEVLNRLLESDKAKAGVSLFAPGKLEEYSDYVEVLKVQHDEAVDDLRMTASNELLGQIEALFKDPDSF